MKKFVIAVFAVCLVLSMVAVGADKAAAKGSWTGWVTDEKCASGDKAGDAACAKKCIDGGAKAVFVNEKDKSVLAIHNPDAVKGHEGHHVTVKGSVTDNQLHVDSVKMVASADKKEAGHKM